MASLFSKLFHAGSSERNRREDFLTEIFADLLGRLPHSEQLSFCTEFLLPKQDDADKRDWIARAEKSDQFSWRTQARVIVVGADHPKRPDIVLYDDNGRPLMVIECKISAGFTDGTLVTDGGDRRTSLDQLGWYDKWLHAASEGTAALVLLTHLVR
jgi:hypothetical protein